MSHSTVEAAADIRKLLKKAYGITSKQVSVRCHLYSMGSSIYIQIHDPAVDLKEVENVANGKEEVRYDESGDILSGGNRFVDAKYSSKATAIFYEQHKTMIDRMVAAKPAEGIDTWTEDPECGMGLAWKDGHILGLYSKTGFLRWVSHYEGHEAITLSEALLINWKKSPELSLV